MEMRDLVIIIHTKNHIEPIVNFLDYKKYNIIIFGPYLDNKIIKDSRLTLKNCKTNFLLVFIFILHKKFGLKTKNYIIFFDFFANRFLKNLYNKNSNPKVLYSFALGANKIFNYNSTKGGINILDRACPSVDFQQNKLIIANRELEINYQNIDNCLLGRMISEYHLSNFIIVPSTYTSTSFNSYLTNKIKIIPLYGKIDIDIDSIENNFIYSDKFLTIGGNYVRKGFVNLIEIFNTEQFKDFNLIIKSNTIPNDIFIPENVKIISNYLTKSQLFELYSETPFFILNSIDEGFGMVVLEAMALGKIVFISPNVGAKDVIINECNGFVYNSTSELLNYINKCKLGLYDLKSISMNAIKTSKDFNINNYCTKWIELLSNILEK